MINANLSAFSVGKAVGRGGGAQNWSYSGNAEIIRTNAKGGTTDGTNYYIITNDSSWIVKYNSSWTEDIRFFAGGPDQGLTWDGTYLRALDGDGSVKTFNTSGTQISAENFVISGGPSSGWAGIVYGDNGYWACNSGANRVYRLNASGVVQSSFLTSPDDYSPSGLAYDGTYLYFFGPWSDKIFQTSTVGVRTGVEIDVSSQTGNGEGMFSDNGTLWLVSRNPDKAFQYTKS